MDKVSRYNGLVASRRACTDCVGLNVVPLGSCRHDEYGVNHIGPFTDWQGNLNAELMVVGREWGGVETYRNQHGKDKDTDPTNENLVKLVNSIAAVLGVEHILRPSNYQQREPRFKGPHFFTNSMLCLKHGGATRTNKEGDPDPTCYERCATKFLKQQIDLVQPTVVVTLGEQAYKATALAYEKKPVKGMAAILKKGRVQLTTRTTLVPLYHPGYYGTLSRNKHQQMEDWQAVVEAVLEAR